MLTKLLDHLQGQARPGVGVIVYRDNLQAGYGDKCQTLVDSSEADYVSFLDDDDWVVDDFVPAIMHALEQHPDYVGFKVLFTEDGVKRMPVVHSLEHDGWHNTRTGLYRDINHFNPIRRSLALMADWAGDNGADRRWADQLRSLGVVKHEVFIDRELHHYRRRSDDTFHFSSVQPPLAVEPPVPDYGGFVTWL